MNSSTEPLPSAQARPNLSTSPPRYIATSGQDLVEESLTLCWLVRILLDRCQRLSEDVALWLLSADEEPRLVAAIRPGPHGRASVQWL